MDFREWLLQEMAHIKAPEGLEIDGKVVSVIDMHFEHYPSEMKDILGYRSTPFVALVPGSENLYMIWDGKKATLRQGSFPLHNVHLPDDWWEYAEVVFEDGSHKASSKSADAVLGVAPAYK